MKIVEISNRTSTLINELLEVWEDSVKATHTFLSIEEIESIKEYVPQVLKEVSHLIVVKDENNMPIAFMGIENGKIVSLLY